MKIIKLNENLVIIKDGSLKYSVANTKRNKILEITNLDFIDFLIDMFDCHENYQDLNNESLLTLNEMLIVKLLNIIENK